MNRRREVLRSDNRRRRSHRGLIDDGLHAGGCGGNVLRGEASRVIGHLARKSDDAVLGHDINGGGFQERLGIELGLYAGGDVVVARLVAAESKEERERKSGEK